MKSLTTRVLEEVRVYYADKQYSLKFGYAACDNCEFYSNDEACEKFKSDIYCNYFIFQEHLTLSEKLDRL